MADLNLKPTKEMFSTEERDLDEMVETFTEGKVLGRFEWERERGQKNKGPFSRPLLLRPSANPFLGGPWEIEL